MPCDSWYLQLSEERPWRQETDFDKAVFTIAIAMTDADAESDHTSEEWSEGASDGQVGSSSGLHSSHLHHANASSSCLDEQCDQEHTGETTNTPFETEGDSSSESESGLDSD